MFCLENYLIHNEVWHGEIRFYRVQESETGQQMYLTAEPEGMHPLLEHAGLQALQDMGIDRGFRWQAGPAPTDPSLRAIWISEELAIGELANCLLQIAEGLAHLARKRPALLPDCIAPDHIYHLGSGRWVLDLPGLAFSPGVGFGPGSNLIQAMGDLLRQLMEVETVPYAGGGAMSRPASPALRFIMMRCLWGGFASLEEFRQALTQLTEGAEPQSRAEIPTLPDRPPSVRTRGWRGWIASGAALALFVAAGLMIHALAQPRETSDAAPEQALSSALPTHSSAARSPQVALTLPDSLSDDDLPRFARQNRAVEPEPAVVTDSKAHPPVPSADPITAADRATAGENLVTVRVLGYAIGQVYMFTNPGAPVISLDALARILKRPLRGEITDSGELRVVDAARRFDTASFLVLNSRIWLILTPEVMTRFRVRVTGYGNGVLDLEPLD